MISSLVVIAIAWRDTTVCGTLVQSNPTRHTPIQSQAKPIQS